MTVVADRESFVELVADRIAAAAVDAVARRGRFDLVLSGGNTPGLVFDRLVGDDRLNWSRTRLFWVDERMVPPDDPQSNYGLAHGHLSPVIDQCTLFRIQGELEPDVAAADYAEVLKSNVLIENGLPRFDFMLLGVGTDGHVGSIFSPEEVTARAVDWVYASYVEKLDQWRVTMNMPVISNARACLIMALGADKAMIHQRSTARDLRLPISYLQPDHGSCEWILGPS